MKLIRKSAIYCLILISDSIMVPCYGRITPNIKGCASLCLIVKMIFNRFFDIKKSLGKATFLGNEGS